MAVTVNYAVPGQPAFAPGTNPPTLAQMAALSMLNAQVIFGDTDLLGTITHNMAIPVALLGSFVPLTIIVPQVLGTTPLSVLGSLLNSNTVVLSKASGVGSNGTYLVTVLRPNTLIE